jgi:beta-galactosidase GanA
MIKDIETIKNEVAKKHGYKDWKWIFNYDNENSYWRLKLIDECMQEHAKQVAEAQRELDIKNATANYNAEVDEDSIRNHPLVTDNI